MAMLLCGVWPSPAAGQWQQADQVERGIQRGIQSLLARITPEDTIQYRTKKKRGQVKTVQGHVIKDRGGILQVKTRDGKRISVRKRLIIEWHKSGFVRPEMSDLNETGPSALVAFALISAGVETTHPRMRQLIGALANHNAKKTGTYVHSLRASVWSLLLDRPISQRNKKKYRRLLKKDVNWLIRGMGGDGTYDYGRSGGNGDNSNTQFANLGLWSGSIANIEVADRTWQNIANYWLKTQHPGGGWSYRTRVSQPTSSMTIAGCNSLYIVLDRYFARSDQPYRWFEGARPNKMARVKMDRVYRAINDGDQYLKLHPPDLRGWQGYELFGLERLGLAGGLARIGERDWFRQNARKVASRVWGTSPVTDAFSLIFLVHGQAPVLMQKLEHGEDIHDWNYYHRDLNSLTRYLSHTFERLYRWQRIPADATLENMRDAPILQISGRKRLELSADALRRIRRYVDLGGTVFLHANRAGKPFRLSTTEVFEQMFADRSLTFEKLKPSHPIYHCYFGRNEKDWKKHIPLLALHDGPRIMVLLCPVDIAGAWHQDRRRFEDLFRIMANIRVYCAPGYAELPRVLRSEPQAYPSASPLGSLRLFRLKHAGDWDAHLGVWQRQHDSLLRRTGLELEPDERGETLDDATEPLADVVYLTTRGDETIDADTIDALKDYLRGGGFLLIDSADGQSAGNLAVRRLMDAIDIGERDVLPADHPIVTGAFPGGRPLMDLETTSAGASLNRDQAPPPILTRTLDGRLAIAACPFDLAAGLDGHFIWKRIGYSHKSTLRIVDNILLWRLNDHLQRRAVDQARNPSEPRP